ncbi:Mut7-C ubiquitin/RNAse domain-containing protein [Aquabacterium sp. A7-Y]|uniref:Mut7-C RNAse domain-containing protein n=1 Tax=Aquabacterium sp. A7-Y TaxID=1349605 RepID=UPI00223CFC14|nr:Mut7-C RNAse domain-containing protein [Aquabacterium sp. A7-Y]MCW7538763.1 Mut7-C ubiquitin/RNAse domain-containing protein [Aquabacterium sp. A7-Y]
MSDFRFYAELNDFLPLPRRGRSFTHAVAPHESLKHAIESLGVPHTEVGLVLLDGVPVGLQHRPLGDGGRVAVYPAWQTLGPVPAVGLADVPPRRFIADAHLGRLARYLRFAGYDTLYRNDWPDAELAALARAEDRTVLTRDRDLLMHRDVVHGCYLRAIEPLEQLRELVARLRLDARAPRASRCLLCNTPLAPAAKEAVADRLLPRTLADFDEFWRCPDCERVYWRGLHWQRLRAALGKPAGGGA